MPPKEMLVVKNQNKLILFCLILFGAVIRFWNVWLYPYHVDEIFTLKLVAQPFWDVLVFGLSQHSTPVRTTSTL